MEPEKIVFPCDYPVKVVARAGPDLRARLDAAFTQHFGPFDAARVSVRESAQANFVSFTYLMHVQDTAQLEALHRQLRDSDGIMLVL